MRSLAEELALETNYADIMSDAARMWMKRAQDAEHLVSILILAAGGEIRVRDGHLLRAKSLKLSKTYNQRDMETVFRAQEQE